MARKQNWRHGRLPARLQLILMRFTPRRFLREIAHFGIGRLFESTIIHSQERDGCCWLRARGLSARGVAGLGRPADHRGARIETLPVRPGLDKAWANPMFNERPTSQPFGCSSSSAQVRAKCGVRPRSIETCASLRILFHVSETPDKRRRSDLDLFVLALIESGIATAYELQRAAGLSPGATIPALRRLVERGLAQQGRSGARGRIAHRITSAGRRHLQAGWRELVDAGPSGDLDADLRVALLALWVGGNRRLAVDFLRQSANRKLGSIGFAPENAHNQETPPLLARWYQELRRSAADALRKREAAAMLAMAKDLPRRRSEKSGAIKKRGRSKNPP